MDDYLIGAGAVLTAGAAGSIAGASLHAQVDPRLSGQVRAAMVDFEAGDLSELSRVVILATGWSVGRFEEQVSRKLPAAGRLTTTATGSITPLGDGCGLKTSLGATRRFTMDDGW
jgi:hypothetical protein